MYSMEKPHMKHQNISMDLHLQFISSLQPLQQVV